MRPGRRLDIAREAARRPTAARKYAGWVFRHGGFYGAENGPFQGTELVGLVGTVGNMITKYETFGTVVTVVKSGAIKPRIYALSNRRTRYGA